VASKLASNCRNFPNDLSVSVSELLSLMNSVGIGVNDQAVVLSAAAAKQVGSVTLEDDVQRLLP
jgi:hypothetical protein